MDKVKKGKYIISAAKSLKRYQLADATIAAFLYATSHAGRVGLLVSALRHNKNVSLGHLTILAAEEGFSPLELSSRLAPWLDNSQLCRVKWQDEQISSVDSLILSYDGLLTAVSDLYDSLSPPPEDIGCLCVLEAASQLPTPESDVLHAVALVVGEEAGKRAISLAKNYKIVSSRSGKGLREPILFSEKLWSSCISKAATALDPLNTDQRAVVLDLLEQVRNYQGFPESLLRDLARQNNAEPMLNLAIGVGLLNRTDIQMADGTSRVFLTSPHFYGDLESEFGEDMCDRVKIFLDSTRNGQHFGHPWTGRILDPDKLLSKLINTGEIGPCSAIGTDWVTSELAGIVTVKRVDPQAGKCYLELVQKDTVSKVHQIITTGTMDVSQSTMKASHVAEGRHFHSIEYLRAEAGELPGDWGEAERAIIMKLRES